MLPVLRLALRRARPGGAALAALTDLITRHPPACFQLCTEVRVLPFTLWGGILSEGLYLALPYLVSTLLLRTLLTANENLTTSVSQ